VKLPHLYLECPLFARFLPERLIVVQAEFELFLERLLLNFAHHCADIFVALFLRKKIDDATTEGVELLANSL